MAGGRRPGEGYAGSVAQSGLAEVFDIILDKGLVVDAYVHVSLVGIELLTIDARIVIASVDTYLRFAEAVGRLDIAETGAERAPELLQTGRERFYKAITKGAIEGVEDVLGMTEPDRRD